MMQMCSGLDCKTQLGQLHFFCLGLCGLGRAKIDLNQGIYDEELPSDDGVRGECQVGGRRGT